MGLNFSIETTTVKFVNASYQICANQLIYFIKFKVVFKVVLG